MRPSCWPTWRNSRRNPRLSALCYPVWDTSCSHFGDGLYAAGNISQRRLPLCSSSSCTTRSGLAVRKRELVGKHICRSATLAAGLCGSTLRGAAAAALVPDPAATAPERYSGPSRSSASRGASFLAYGATASDGLTHWFALPGSNPILAFRTPQSTSLEAAVPVLQALLHLKADIQLRAAQHGVFSDAPLQPRLTISAAHGGSHGSALPALLDILVSRRYDPAESVHAALGGDQIHRSSAAASRSLRVDVSITEHESPVTGSGCKQSDTRRNGRSLQDGDGLRSRSAVRAC